MIRRPLLPNVATEDMVVEENVINMGIWVINVYGFDYPNGNYVFDYYIYFFWSDPNITTVQWYMMNGKPSNPATKEMVSNGTLEGFNFEFWRVRADLSYPLEAGNYPFEPVTLPISIEVVNPNKPGQPYQLRWMEDSSGVDPGFKIVGWDVFGRTLFDDASRISFRGKSAGHHGHRDQKGDDRGLPRDDTPTPHLLSGIRLLIPFPDGR